MLTVAAPGVLTNDYDMEGDPMTPSVVSNPSHGTLTFNSDGSFTYEPDTHYVGSDSFTYNLSDGATDGTTATVLINVTNSAPYAGNDSFTILHDHSLTASVPGVLMNDYDMDGDPITATLMSSTSHGTLTFNSDGSFTYEPDFQYVGSDSFTYTPTDGITEGSAATVMITVTNNAPVFAERQTGGPDDSYLDTDPEESSSSVVIGELEATDSDGDTLTYSGTGPSFINVASDGTVRVTSKSALMDYFDSHATLSVPVFVTDGISTVASYFLLDHSIDGEIIPARYMYVRDTAGTIYSPTDAAGLKNALESIRTAGEQVDLLVIKGHGGTGGCQISATEYLTVAGGDIYFGDFEVTQLMKDVTNASSKIYLRCCFSAWVAKPLAESLDGARVWGARRFTINIPGTPWGLYAWKSYSN